jgi:hypothetical protein
MICKGSIQPVPAQVYSLDFSVWLLKKQCLECLFRLIILNDRPDSHIRVGALDLIAVVSVRAAFVLICGEHQTSSFSSYISVLQLTTSQIVQS